MTRMREGSTTEDYRRALAGEGDIAYEWSDKPHRLVYDLCGEVEALQAQIAAMRDEVKACGFMFAWHEPGKPTLAIFPGSADLMRKTFGL